LEAVLEMRHIVKRFGEITALDGVSLAAEPGQVHAIIGENGAGKSTLMRILAGVHVPDEGEIRLNGETVAIQNPKQAQDLGIAMIHQEIKLFQDLNIAENVFIRREPLKGWRGLHVIDWTKAYRETDRYLREFGLDLSSRRLVQSLSYGQQKFVEIIKALSQQARIIVMDEPTTALTEQEIHKLFSLIRDLKRRGVTILYVSHRLEEIRAIADKVTVLRDGKVVRCCDAAGIDLNELVLAMAGKDFHKRYPKMKVKIGKELMRVERLSYGGILRDISFSLHQGEIVGLTGISGSERRTLSKVLFGIHGPFEGAIHLNGKTFRAITPHEAKANGLCYVTGIGTEEGLISGGTVAENITLTNLERVSRFGFLNSEKEAEFAQDLIERLEITADNREIVGNLSGGKQKKVIFAKWLFSNAKVLIIEEPTAGIDVGSKVDIYNIMNELLLEGASILMISSDLSELLGMCDKIMVMCDGEIRQVFQRGEATKERILYYASGGK